MADGKAAWGRHGSGDARRKKPATKELADALLRPLTTWQTTPVKKAAKESGAAGGVEP